MNKKERVLNALQGKPVDRVPVTFYRHFFSQEDNTVSANVDWVKNTGMDMICVEPDGFYALHWAVSYTHLLGSIEDING